MGTNMNTTAIVFFYLFNKHLNASFLFGFAYLSHLMLIAQSQFQVLPKFTFSFQAQ